MEKDENTSQPVFSHAEPVLAVRDIPEAISYWQNVLGFPAKWTWGDPPNHGGVSRQKVFIQFTQNPELAAASKGNSIWIKVQHIEALYKSHQQKNAEIVVPLTNRPWGMTEYTIREINGYYIHFSAPTTEREKSKEVLPATIRIIGRKPTVKEFRSLELSLGNTSLENEEMTEKRLNATVFASVAEDTTNGQIVGCALLLGDHASFYYIKDVMVVPELHGKRIGTALLQEINNWLEKNAANKSLVALITGETLEPFYQQFGFAPAFSMIRYVFRND